MLRTASIVMILMATSIVMILMATSIIMILMAIVLGILTFLLTSKMMAVVFMITNMINCIVLVSILGADFKNNKTTKQLNKLI